MVRLVLVEVRRTLARGVTKLLTVAGVGAILFVGVLTFVVVTPADAVRARAQAEFEQQVEYCMAGMAGPSLRPPPGPGGQGPDTFAPPTDRASCERSLATYRQAREGQVFQLTDLWPGPPDFGRSGPPDPIVADLPALLSGIVVLPGLILLVGALVAGASMVGADWQAGSLTTLLTWEPRRVRLLVARMVACALVGAVIAVGLLALFTALFWVIAAAKGELPADADWWVGYVGVVLRLSGLTGLAAVVGAALAMLGKRTALAVFALPVYLIGAEVVLRIRWEAVRPWLLLRNLALVLGGEDYLPDAGSALRGTAVLLGWSAVIVAASFVAFARKDFASSS